MSTLNILFEGWRFIPHGRGLAGQGLALGLVGRPAVRLFHKDLPWLGASELMAGGIHAPLREQQLRQLMVPSSAHPPDMVVRTGWGDEAFERVSAPALVLAPTLRAKNLAAQLGTFRSALALTKRGISLWAPSHWVRNHLLNAGVAENHVVTLPFGVDPKVFAPASTPMRDFWRKRFGFDGFTFLHVGTMAAHTGLAQLVTAFARVARRHSDARLVLKSVDRLHEGPRALAGALALLTAADLHNVIDRISYMGEAVSLVEMAGLYQASDTYLAGHGSSFGRPTLEAMGCGTPVICSEGGPSDDFAHADVVLRAASDGARVCSEAMAESMERLMLSNDLQKRLSTASPVWVHHAWTWAHAAERLLSFVPGAPMRAV
ncbi:MAG: glycosyltransferase family 4 protein [Deltaproteobacteria bacterium]|nr:glycosyltransferase family 4 protein [Deltaproteobacteria bacterium]